MIHKETRHIIVIALIFALRMLGLFMILPILSQYAQTLPGANAITIGWAFGAYGLSQALLQIPLGLCSDRWGRKPIITVGLLFFLAGSIVAALATHITTIIIGRVLQGAGAIGSTLLALLADLTTEEQRTKAMASVGLTIGFAFMLALFLGPWIAHRLGLSGIFWVMAVFAIVALMLLHSLLPKPSRAFHHIDIQATFKQIPMLLNRNLNVLNFSIFSLHALLTVLFMAIPGSIAAMGLTSEQAALRIYLPTLFIAGIFMVPLIIIAEHKRRMKLLFIASIATLLCCVLLLWQWQHNTVIYLVLILACFFSAFNVLEACLPSWVSKIAPIRAKGTAIGIYSSCQFFGIFMGGVLGGWCLSAGGTHGIYIMCIALTAVWLVLAFTINTPQYLQTMIIKTAKITSEQALELTQQLLQLAGVADVAVSTEEDVAYLKIDRQRADRNSIQRLVHSFT